MRAHPRAGGENEQVIYAAPALWGSSPRGRGKPGPGRARPAPLRLIPARAGKTRSTAAGGAGRRAHPRAGGENIECRPECDEDDGSSPRGRGKPARATRCRRDGGLIPARAGKTCSVPSRRRSRSGSSPRGRGKRSPHENEGEAWGLIPARAGKTRSAGSGRSQRRAHPRAGGENDVRAP